MTYVQTFYDFEAFKKSRAFVKELGREFRTRPFSHEFNLRNQMERAAISVLSNFAEGYKRNGSREFAQFVSISKGSVGELRSQLIYAYDQGLLLRGERYAELESLGEEASRVLRTVILSYEGRATRQQVSQPV